MPVTVRIYNRDCRAGRPGSIEGATFRSAALSITALLDSERRASRAQAGRGPASCQGIPRLTGSWAGPGGAALTPGNARAARDRGTGTASRTRTPGNWTRRNSSSESAAARGSGPVTVLSVTVERGTQY
jgi:hypothetical protein